MKRLRATLPLPNLVPARPTDRSLLQLMLDGFESHSCWMLGCEQRCIMLRTLRFCLTSIEGTPNSPTTTLQYVRIDHRRPHIRVPKLRRVSPAMKADVPKNPANVDLPGALTVVPKAQLVAERGQ
jgi:hypothetical protein